MWWNDVGSNFIESFWRNGSRQRKTAFVAFQTLNYLCTSFSNKWIISWGKLVWVTSQQGNDIALRSSKVDYATTGASSSSVLCQCIFDVWNCSTPVSLSCWLTTGDITSTQTCDVNGGHQLSGNHKLTFGKRLFSLVVPYTISTIITALMLILLLIWLIAST